MSFSEAEAAIMTSVEKQEDGHLVQAADTGSGSATLSASLNRLLASAVGSLIAESITLPTDVVKTRSDGDVFGL